MLLGTLRYSGRGQGGRRPEVAMVKTRSLAALLNDELVFFFSVQKLLFVQDFRSFSLQKTHLSGFCVVFSQG